MRLLLGLVALLLVGTTAPALADEPVIIETTTTLAATSYFETVTLTITVTSADGSTPEGTIVVTDGSSPVTTVSLTSGTATWSGGAPAGSHSYVAGFIPADERWSASASLPAPITTAAYHPCSFVDECVTSFSIRVSGAQRIKLNDRARLRILLDTRWSGRQNGDATATVTGPGRFAWSWTAHIGDHAALLRTPRLTRPGHYVVQLSARLDAGLERLARCGSASYPGPRVRCNAVSTALSRCCRTAGERRTPRYSARSPAAEPRRTLAA